MTGMEVSTIARYGLNPIIKVMLDAGNNFISGWKLTGAQVVGLLTTGNIGGG